MIPTGENALNPQKINIAQVIENSKNKRFAINLIIWTFLLSLLEAVDVSIVSYVAPVLIKEWNIEPGLFGTVFGVGTFGLMVGGFIFGYLGDQIGRKKSLIIGTIWFSFFTFTCIWVDSVTVFLYLRFLACVGIGGALPLSIVLVNEYAPKRSRGKWVAWMFTGFPFGMSVGGFLTALLLPNFGWQSLFIFGGTVPFLLAIGLYFKLPESIRFLILKNKDQSEITKLISWLHPDMVLCPNAKFKFIVPGEEKSTEFSLKFLFAGALRFVTPLVWLFYIINSATVYFLNSWLPQLQVATGFSLHEASIATSLYHLAGIVCTVVVGWLYDKHGILALTIFPLLGCLIVAALGYPKSVIHTTINLFFAGFFVVGTQGILTVTTPTWYPTSYRASANGTAMAIAKIGSILGPVIGGVLMATQLSIQELYFINSAALAIGVIIVFTLGLLYRRYYVTLSDSHFQKKPWKLFSSKPNIKYNYYN